jgi:hypothetical protein
MANAIILYGPRSDSAAFQGGSWSAALPLGNLASPRYYEVARSADASETSTQFQVLLPQQDAFRALVLGHLNVTTSYEYRVRAFETIDFDEEAPPLYDSGWIKPFAGTAILDWGHPNWWVGSVPWDDPERKIQLIHVLPQTISSQFWWIELRDESNPAGFIEAGRLFMAEALNPSINYAYEGNGLTFKDNSKRANTLSGNTEVWRRINPRVMSMSFPTVEQTEAFNNFLRAIRVAGYDGEVFVIPDPDDAAFIQQRSFFGRFVQFDPLSQVMFNRVSTGFQIEEII